MPTLRLTCQGRENRRDQGRQEKRREGRNSSWVWGVSRASRPAMKGIAARRLRSPERSADLPVRLLCPTTPMVGFFSATFSEVLGMPTAMSALLEALVPGALGFAAPLQGKPLLGTPTWTVGGAAPCAPVAAAAANGIRQAFVPLTTIGVTRPTLPGYAGRDKTRSPTSQKKSGARSPKESGRGSHEETIGRPTFQFM